jgi:hypothetical protein
MAAAAKQNREANIHAQSKFNPGDTVCWDIENDQVVYAVVLYKWAKEFLVVRSVRHGHLQQVESSHVRVHAAGAPETQKQNNKDGG